MSTRQEVKGNDVDYSKMRRDVRVKTTLRVRYSLLSEGDFMMECKLMESRTSGFAYHIFKGTSKLKDTYGQEIEETEILMLRILLDVKSRLNRVLNLLEEKDSERLPTMDQGYTEDISAGGILFRGKRGLNLGQKLKLILEIPIFLGIEIEALGEAVNLPTPEEEGVSLAGIKFLYIAEEDKELLVKYIFDRQRDDLKKRRQRKPTWRHIRS